MQDMAEELGYTDKSAYRLLIIGKRRMTVEMAAKIKRKLKLSNQEALNIFLG